MLKIYGVVLEVVRGVKPVSRRLNERIRMMAPLGN
jgi:hypothetical protein